ncbi:hypothetical protein [Nocardia lijiangensis]|uniref:hypothetical protein n=1 Tax=Nocardia lijiangensis TaxID=299618 RepID=UPI003D706CDE
MDVKLRGEEGDSGAPSRADFDDVRIGTGHTGECAVNELPFLVTVVVGRHIQVQRVRLMLMSKGIN